MADQEVFGKVVEVTHRADKSKKTGKPYNLYSVKLDDGNEYKTFKTEVGVGANELKGSQVKARVHDETRPDGQGGFYPTEFYIDGIEAISNGALPASPGVPATVVENTSSSAKVEPVAGYHKIPEASSKDDNIRALSAFRAAVDYVALNGTGDPEKDAGLVYRMAQEFYKNATPEALTRTERADASSLAGLEAHSPGADKPPTEKW